MDENNKVLKEQEILAFESAKRDIKRIVIALESGKTVAELSKGCESVCGHACTDGYESGVCNIKRWLTLLDKGIQDGYISEKVLLMLLKSIK